jgi:hypothetical protein
VTHRVTNERVAGPGLPLFVLSEASQVASLVAVVNAGELRVNVAERVPRNELRNLRQTTTGFLSGRIVVLATA